MSRIARLFVIPGLTGPAAEDCSVGQACRRPRDPNLVSQKNDSRESGKRLTLGSHNIVLGGDTMSGEHRATPPLSTEVSALGGSDGREGRGGSASGWGTRRLISWRGRQEASNTHSPHGVVRFKRTRTQRRRPEGHGVERTGDMAFAILIFSARIIGRRSPKRLPAATRQPLMADGSDVEQLHLSKIDSGAKTQPNLGKLYNYSSN